MDINGNYNINNNNKNNNKSIVIKHENKRLEDLIDKLKSKLENNQILYNNLNTKCNEYQRKIDISIKEINRLNLENQKLVEKNNTNSNVNNKYYHEYNKIKNDINILKTRNKELEYNYKNIVVENNNLLNNNKLLTDPKSVISKNKINEILNLKKQYLINNIYKSYRENINNYIDNLINEYTNWLNIFRKNWTGDKDNILSLSNDRNIQLIKYFGGKLSLDENNIPIKKIIIPNNEWILTNDKEILCQVILDYITYSNILPKSIPGCNNFYNESKDNYIFDVISSCILNKDDIYTEDFFNSKYVNAKYWSNYLDNFNKSIVCSDNIINLNNKISELKKIKLDLLNLFKKIDDKLNKFIITDVNYFIKDWNDILKDLDIVNDIITEENTIYNELSLKFNKDEIYIQIDYAKCINKEYIIQWLRKYSIDEKKCNNNNIYFITDVISNIKNYVNYIENNKLKKKINNTSIYDNWLIIKTADEYRNNIDINDNINSSILSTLINNILSYKNNIDNIFTNIIDII